jgi:hypothetical protein
MLQEIKSAGRLKGLGYMKRTECKEKHYRKCILKKKGKECRNKRR